MEKTILVAIDGGVLQRLDLDYTWHGSLPPTAACTCTCNVAPSGGAGKEWMFDVDPHRSPTAGSDQQTPWAHRHLREAGERLQRAGVSAERIQARVRVATGGIRCDHPRRGGAGQLRQPGDRPARPGGVGSMLFSSTSGELVEKCQRVPLWIVDGKVSSHRFLLAVHCQPASLKAADHLGFVLKNHPDAEICLYHSDSVFGKQAPARAEEFHAQWGRAWCDRHLDIDNFLFYAHAQMLMDNGVGRRRITQLPVQMHLDVSSDLLRQARATTAAPSSLAGGPGAAAPASSRASPTRRSSRPRTWPCGWPGEDRREAWLSALVRPDDDHRRLLRAQVGGGERGQLRRGDGGEIVGDGQGPAQLFRIWPDRPSTVQPVAVGAPGVADRGQVGSSARCNSSARTPSAPVRPRSGDDRASGFRLVRGNGQAGLEQAEVRPDAAGLAEHPG